MVSERGQRAIGPINIAQVGSHGRTMGAGAPLRDCEEAQSMKEGSLVGIVDWCIEPERWLVRILFVTIGWDGALHLLVGGHALSLCIDGHGISLGMGMGEEGVSLKTTPTILVVLALLLIGRLRWWSVVLGLTLIWVVDYALDEGGRDED